jgi:hypothetical protein
LKKRNKFQETPGFPKTTTPQKRMVGGDITPNRARATGRSHFSGYSDDAPKPEQVKMGWDSNGHGVSFQQEISDSPSRLSV